MGCLVQAEVGRSACSLVLALRFLLLVAGPIGLSRSSTAPCQWAQVSRVMANAQAALVSFMLNAMFGQDAASPSRVVLHVTAGAVDSLVFDVEARVELERPFHGLVILLVAVLRGVHWALLILGRGRLGQGWARQADTTPLGLLLEVCCGLGLLCFLCLEVVHFVLILSSRIASSAISC